MFVARCWDRGSVFGSCSEVVVDRTRVRSIGFGGSPLELQTGGPDVGARAVDTTVLVGAGV